ncbi:Flavin-dependent monooxygenase-like protein [Cladobotryum mycophilum]|uniref:Flavin-dependent monooxygenase-like protein n=1 Tax=Cladobotryum mycophilum TaxID=491253 RepID=A0ABR0SBJ9_9HYPO
MLARLLHLGGVSATVFEGEESASFRSQGGTLDLHPKSGLAAMQEAQLSNEFNKCARYDGQYLAVVDKTLKYHIVRGVDETNAAGGRPEIDRVKLRQILMDSLPQGTIKWGHRLREVEDNTLIFDSTTASGFDLVVGADGAWSKIRKAIAPELQPVYSDCAMFDLRIPDAKTTAPDVYKLVNRGSLFGSADGQRLALQQIGDGSIQVYAAVVRQNPEWMKPELCGYNTEDLNETKMALAKEFADWSPQLRQAFDLAQGNPIARSLFRLPVGSRWENRKGFTLIGDAAHLMTPHSGEGVNQALEDAMILARAILRAKNKDELDQQVHGFEEDMFSRLKDVQQVSYDLCQLWMFTPGAPKAAVDNFKSRHRKRAEEHAATLAAKNEQKSLN